VPLRGDITHLRFSPDGKYLLAQDASTITVLTREPFAVHYRVDMEDAFPAGFSMDSKTLIAYNKNRRVQKWDLEKKSLITADEIAMLDGYWQSRISPDGKYLACYRYNGDFLVYEVATNTEIFRKKEFYLPTRSEYFTWRLMRILLDQDEIPAINIEFSPDGKYLLAGRKGQSNIMALGSRLETLGLDLNARKEISIAGNIKDVLVSSMDFMGPDKVIGQFGNDIKKSGIFAFPSGDRLDQFELSGASFMWAQSGDYVTVRPVQGAAVGVYDIKAKKYVLANKKAALDVYGAVFAAERTNGEVALYKMGTNQPIAAVSLPASPFANLRTSAVSDDGNWLTVSDRSRGAVWNLLTGERVLHIRAFRGSTITSDGKVFADFPKQGETERSIAVMDPTAVTVTATRGLSSEDNVRQHGQFLLVRRSNKQKREELSEKEKEKQEQRRIFTEEEPEKSVGFENTTFEIRDVRDGGTLWTRTFQNETPYYFVNAEDNRIGLWWYLSSKAAKAIIAADPALQARVSKMQEKEGDRLVEFVDATTGKVTGHFLLETGEGSIAVERLSAWGDYLAVDDSDNRVLVYSISSGQLLYRFFGAYCAISESGRLMAVENLPGRVAIHDLKTGREIERLSFSSPVARMSFLDGGKRFFVLTNDQTVYMFDPAKFAAEERLAFKE
jgi:WD40 repeat protein